MKFENMDLDHFDMSLATLFRINDLLKESSNAWLNVKVFSIRSILGEIHKELLPFLKPEEKAESEKLWDQIMACKVVSRGFGGNSIESRVFPLLREFDIYCREKLKEKGLLFKKPKDPIDHFRGL